MKYYLFTCPHCCHPGAQARQDELDIHCGAIYECDECGKRVIFEVMTIEQYDRYTDWLTELAEKQKP